MFGFFSKKEDPAVPVKRSKNYFKGVAAIRSVMFRHGPDKMQIMSIYVPDAIKWLQENQTDKGWCNVNIVPMQDPDDKRSHVAYLNERLTPRHDKGTEQD